jgi:hypothetical protein
MIIIYGLLKMSWGQTVPDPELELLNAKSLDFAKPKLFFKNIGHYLATSTYIHVRVPFNFAQAFETKKVIAATYDQLLAKHEEPFKAIAYSTMDVSLMTIEARLQDIHNIIKALPQSTEILMPGWPKCFMAIGISIATMALSSFNTYRITQLDGEITSLKGKTDLPVDFSQLYKAHLHHLEDKMDATYKRLSNILEANIWLSSKITNAVEKKFQSVVHHHENIID